MTDIQGLRAQLQGHAAGPTQHQQRWRRRHSVLGDRSGRGGARLCDRAVHAALLHHAAHRGVAGRAERAAPPEPAESAPPHAAPPQAAVAQAPEAPASRYAGKAPEEVVRTVEVVCDERARVLRGASSGTNGPKAADEKLHCFLTEAPARFCAPNVKRKATADVINYFKGIEYTNKAIIVAAKLKGTAADGVLGAATIDPRVVEAVEGLMRAGYLTKAHRDEIAANVPADIKDRLRARDRLDADLPEATLVDLAVLALAERRLDQPDGVLARPFGGAGECAELAAVRIDQQRRRHADRLADGLEILEHLRARIRIVAEPRDSRPRSAMPSACPGCACRC